MLLYRMPVILSYDHKFPGAARHGEGGGRPGGPRRRRPRLTSRYRKGRWLTMTAPDISLGGWFAARAIRSAGRRALTFEERTWTYGQLIERVDRLAAGLRELGACHGDRIGYLGTNHPALLETMLAASRLGAIFVPLNFRLTGRELSVIARDAGLHTLVAGGAQQPVIDGVRGQLAGALLRRRRGRGGGLAGVRVDRGPQQPAALPGHASRPTRWPFSCTRQGQRASPRASCSRTPTCGGITRT